MKKFLLSLALVAMATPAWAVTVANWASNPIVSGDKTYTLNSSSGLGDPNVDVAVVDNGLVHSLNLSGLSTTSSNFSLNFTVAINSGTNVIDKTRVSQNDVLGNATAGSITDTTGGGTFQDNLAGTAVGPTNTHSAGTTSVTFDVNSYGVDATNFLSNITFDVLQAAPPAVPEPSTFALAGLAVVGLVIARRRAR